VKLEERVLRDLTRNAGPCSKLRDTCYTMKFISTFKRYTSPRSCAIFRYILMLYDSRLSPTLNGHETKLNSYVRFEVFTVVTMKNAVFWGVAPCRSCVSRRSSETSAHTRSTQHYIPEYDILQN
jgi:hypothetical protein